MMTFEEVVTVAEQGDCTMSNDHQCWFGTDEEPSQWLVEYDVNGVPVGVTEVGTGQEWFVPTVLVPVVWR
jgi:hypothetical protein